MSMMSSLARLASSSAVSRSDLVPRQKRMKSVRIGVDGFGASGREPAGGAQATTEAAVSAMRAVAPIG
jgi:hypothetical protein